MQLDKLEILAEVRKALAEDIGKEDISAKLLPENQSSVAEIISREPMLLCGQSFVEAVFHELDLAIEIEWLQEEASFIDKPTTICRIRGNSRIILTAERTALNYLQTLSATATETRRYVQKLLPFKTKLLDTRKTIPGLRMAQKYAVTCGGGYNHRFGLYDAFLIKENHIKACGSIKKALLRAKEIDNSKFMEVEVQNLLELEEALLCKPDRILLDNFTVPLVLEAVNLNNNCCQLEVSGGVNFDNITDYAETGVDYISVGSITKSIKAIDLSLLIKDVL